MLEKCSLEFYNILQIWVGEVYQLENSFIEIYNFVFFSVRNMYCIFPFPAFLLAKIDAKPEQTRYYQILPTQIGKTL